MLYRFIFYLLERATSAGSQPRHCIKSSRLPVKYSGFALMLLISEEPVNSISMRSSSSACKIISAAASSPLFTAASSTLPAMPAISAPSASAFAASKPLRMPPQAAI